MEKDMPHPASQGDILSMRRHSGLMQGAGEAVSTTWNWWGRQLAWKWSEREGKDENKEGGFKRIYLHEGVFGSRCGSFVSLHGGDVSREGGYLQSSALVSCFDAMGQLFLIFLDLLPISANRPAELYDRLNFKIEKYLLYIHAPPMLLVLIVQRYPVSWRMLKRVGVFVIISPPIWLFLQGND
ncbi:unnamed protein product [Dovyalis caffra]|uniref:Uncharacterized protein n=1 Tax=Dovyalis caffra TaxID=77055 RepID=A0AAV1S222_9ROSI|nr:unnamed protein product [Dovyalis caffra]